MKRNYVYILIFIICFLTFCNGILHQANFFEIISRALTEPGYINNFFMALETVEYRAINPTLFNLIQYIFSSLLRRGIQYDVAVIFGSQLLQMLLPFFAIIGGVKFYYYYNSIMQFEFGQNNRKNYRSTIGWYIVKKFFKIGVSIYGAYIIYLGFVLLFFQGSLGAESRSLFSDLIGNNLYVNHTTIYFMLEGLITTFLMPITYTALSQSVVLLGWNLKEVIATPIVYYYGMATIGYALYSFIPSLAIYINPTVIMANGSYDFNSLLIILVNMTPLFIAFVIYMRRTKRAEI